MRFDFIEIGSSCFKTLAEAYKEDESIKGLTIEPIPILYETIKEYCAESKNKYFLNAAIVENVDREIIDFYHTVNPKMKSIGEAGLGSFSMETISKGINETGTTSMAKVEKISVNCKSFNQVIEDYNITSIGLLKIDAEGCDYEIVKAFISSDIECEAILFEVKPFMSEKQLSELLVSLNSKGYKVQEQSRNVYCSLPDSKLDFNYYMKISKRYMSKKLWLRKINWLKHENKKKVNDSIVARYMRSYAEKAQIRRLS